MDKLIQFLENHYAARTTCSDQDDFCAMDLGNYDDCFNHGIYVGERDLAREIIENYKRGYFNPDEEKPSV